MSRSKAESSPVHGKDDSRQYLEIMITSKVSGARNAAPVNPKR